MKLKKKLRMYFINADFSKNSIKKLKPSFAFLSVFAKVEDEMPVQVSRGICRPCGKSKTVSKRRNGEDKKQSATQVGKGEGKIQFRVGSASKVMITLHMFY